jgi:hypothetical protein
MYTQVDRVWARIKQKARSIADSGQTISFRQARAFVMEFWETECVDAPRDEALDFLAAELMDHVTEYRSKAATGA